jgi:DNA polymerase elongation subunit (family B)
MWLREPNATPSEYEELCRTIEEQLRFPIAFEGCYKWIVFLNSRINPRIPVLNRYYGIFQDGKLKVRGIDLRRHDTAGIVRRCQTDVLTTLSKADNSEEFMTLIPEALTVVRSYVHLIRSGAIPVEELVIEKRLSKNPNEYRNLVPQAIAAKHLAAEGMEVHAGQTINYILTYDKSRINQNRALPTELMDEGSDFDSERYVDLLLSSVVNLLLPFGYDLAALKDPDRQISKAPGLGSPR